MSLMKPQRPRLSIKRVLCWLGLVPLGLWGFGYFASRQMSSEPEMAFWRSTAMALSWFIAALLWLLWAGEVDWTRGEARSVPFIFPNPNVLMPKVTTQSIMEILREGLVFGMVMGVLFALIYRGLRFFKSRGQERGEACKPTDPGGDPDF